MKYFVFAFVVVLTQQTVSAGYYPRDASFNGDIGSQCQYDEDCMTSHAYCRNNRVCECKRKYQYDKSSSTCYPTQLGLKCHTDEDCIMANSRCFEDVCQCRSGHVAAEPSADCLPASRLMASCVDDAQCRSSDDNSHCNPESRICDCLPGYHPAFDTQQCKIDKKIREACREHVECANKPEQQDKVECRSDGGTNRCLCRSGFTEQNNVCVRGYAEDGASSITASISLIILTLCYLLN